LRHFERFGLLVIGAAMIIQVSTAKLRKKKTSVSLRKEYCRKEWDKSQSSANPDSVYALFVWLTSHQPAVIFSKNKSATSSTFISEQTSISHQPNEQAVS
jgi:hypothetical protein